MKFTVNRAVITTAAAVAAAAVIGGTALAASGNETPAVQAVPGQQGEGKYTAGGFELTVREHTDDGEGMGTVVRPYQTSFSSRLAGTEDWKPTLVKFSVGRDPERPAFATYPVPAAGHGLDRVASGTAQSPQINCVATIAH